MKSDGRDLRVLIDHMAELNPSVVQLSEEISLAVRVEPELLRAMRLQSRPELDASAEADLWFGPLVESRTRDWLVLVPKVAQELRRRLALTPERFQKARRLIVRAHEGAPPPLILEEEIIWLALTLNEASYDAIDARLRRILGKLTENPEANLGLARWFASAATRLPDETLKTEAYSLLIFVTSALLDGRHIGEPTTRNLNTFQVLANVLPSTVPKTRIWAGLTNGGLTLLPHPTLGFMAVDLPRTEPLLLDVEVAGSFRLLVALGRGETRTIPIQLGAVNIRTAAGDVYSLQPRRSYVQDQSGFGDFIHALKYGSKILINENFKSRSIIGQQKDAARFDKFLIREAKPIWVAKMAAHDTDSYIR
jgi:hypothetical protein